MQSSISKHREGGSRTQEHAKLNEWRRGPLKDAANEGRESDLQVLSGGSHKPTGSRRFDLDQ